MSPDAATAVFETSKFWPVAIGFFGLGTGYLVGGGQALFKFPLPTPDVEKSMALWSFWMSGFMQFLTGVILIVGLTWFGVFDNAAPLYMAAVAFTAFGVHWFVVAHRRYIGASPAPEGWMSIAFLLNALCLMLAAARRLGDRNAAMKPGSCENSAMMRSSICE